MKKEDKVKNILTFLFILFHEDRVLIDRLMDLSPDYIIEKYERYIESESLEYPWGIHPNLRRELFNAYLRKWDLGVDEDD